MSGRGTSSRSPDQLRESDLKSEIGVAKQIVVLHAITRPSENDAPAVEHVGAVTECQRFADSLLDQ
jgi:hypothetical protein